MSGLVSELRARPGVLVLGDSTADTITIRVQLPELWETVAIRCDANTSVKVIKRAALDAFGEHGALAADFVLKLRGFEVLDETVPITVAGAREGSTLLLTHRRRRPVR